jgi:hypothetical protein
MCGCIGDRVADRTLEIYQVQSISANTGQFEIDVSQLPADAIKSKTTHGGEGTPVTKITIDEKYPIRVVLVPVTKPASDPSSAKESGQKD